MTIRNAAALSLAAILLAGCDSGDITLNPTTIDNSVSGGGGGPVADNPCASYVEAGQTFQGAVDANGNCFYDSLFVSDTRPITVSAITFPNFGGLHIFEDSLHIGEDVDANAAATGKRIPQEGEGTSLTIAAGNTMVFQAADSYLRIARGSQIFAVGDAMNPIAFTADEDAILSVATESDRGLWGGLQINGNGQTNKCHDGTPSGSGAGTISDFAPTANNVHNCHVTSEGRPATYGGANNAENSGALSYVVIKHAGFEVVDGDELNALTLNGVGSGTTIDHVQVYTSQDDGFEMFGGAVSMDHIVAVNVGDDSIDYSEGYNGDIQYAVVVHTSGANRCIEGDNTGGNRADSFTPTTKLRISNLTCATSNVDENAGTNPSSKGDSEGPLFREGTYFEMYNSLVTSSELAMATNECVELDDSEGPETIDAAQAGTSIAISNLIACGEPTKVNTDPANAGFDLGIWLGGGDGSPQMPLNTNANNVVEAVNLPASLIDGGVGTRGYLTLDLLTDSIGGVIFDQTTQLFDASALGGSFENPTYLGGANAGDDWLADWTVGLTEQLVP
ncbi:MAG: hypothetical protein ACJ0SL_02140 [Candidatus Rariloculaceae bacterium]